jgi:hypothetical protein
VVEPKNLVRQNFILPDVGENKAKVLAERYSDAFGMPISYIDKYVEDEVELQNIINDKFPYLSTTIIFSMVDNVKTRLMLSNFLNEEYNSVTKIAGDVVIVDCGNTKYAGQVCISAKWGSSGRFFIPSVAEQQQDLLDPANWDKFASEASCEEANEEDPQTMSANATAANIAMNALYQMLTKRSIHYKKVVFDASNNICQTTYLRPQDRYLKPRIGRIEYK